MQALHNRMLHGGKYMETIHAGLTCKALPSGKIQPCDGDAVVIHK